jgi:ATP-binding cassette subfamily C protein
MRAVERALPILAAYIRTLAAAMPGRLGLVTSLTVIGALTEGVGLLILVPLLHLIGVDVQQGTAGHVARSVTTAFGWLGLPLTLVSVLTLYVSLIGCDVTLRRWQTATYSSLQAGFTAHLRKRLYRAVAQASWVQLTRCRASDLTHAMTGQVERAGLGTQILLSMVRDGMRALVYLGATLYLSLPVTTLLVLAGLVLVLLLGPKTRAASRLGATTSRLSGDTYRSVMEHVDGIKLAKSYGAEERSIRLFDDLADTVAEAHLRAQTAQADAKCRFDIGAALVLGVILYVATAVLNTPAAVVLVLLFAFARVMPLVSAFEQSTQCFLSMVPDFVVVLTLEARLA